MEIKDSIIVGRFFIEENEWLSYVCHSKWARSVENPLDIRLSLQPSMLLTETIGLPLEEETKKVKGGASYFTLDKLF